MKIHTVCLDLDDTLLPNTHKYFVPNLKCATIIAQALGRHGVQPMRLLEMRQEIDVAMVNDDGFSVDRVPKSWARTYELLCEEKGLVPKTKVVMRLMETGARFARGPFKLLPGVPRMLRRLREQKRLLHLVTAGPEELQRRKIDETGVQALFNLIHVTKKDKKPYLAAVVKAYDPAGLAMVGDSLRSDIKPAVELGMTAVYIHSETWAYAKAHVDPSKFHRLDDITKLPEFLEEIEKAA